MLESFTCLPTLPSLASSGGAACCTAACLHHICMHACIHARAQLLKRKMGSGLWNNSSGRKTIMLTNWTKWMDLRHPRGVSQFPCCAQSALFPLFSSLGSGGGSAFWALGWGLGELILPAMSESWSNWLTSRWGECARCAAHDLLLQEIQ